MKEMNLESLLNSEMENIKGGSGDTICKCISAAAAKVTYQRNDKNIPYLPK